MRTRNSKRRWFGPGTIVAAAFIGPGTVTICSIAGVQSAYSMLFALLVATIATIILQEMAARLGLISKMGLAENIRIHVKEPLNRVLVIFVAFLAIVVGNAAYEGGNIAGASLGLESLWGEDLRSIWKILIYSFAFLLMWLGQFKYILRTLIGIVLFMSAAFIITAFSYPHDISAIISGLFKPDLNLSDPWLFLGIIGTTVVPYNLFLHSASIQEYYQDHSQLRELRFENIFSISLGGFISMCILITAAAFAGQYEIQNASDLAIQLEPSFGKYARYLMAVGLFGAGISSAITAPLAAAYAAKGLFGWTGGMKSPKFRATWIAILSIGFAFSAFGTTPIELIKLAQIANGILLPFIAVILVLLINRKEIMGKFTNTLAGNILSFLVILFCMILGIKGIMQALNIL